MRSKKKLQECCGSENNMITFKFLLLIMYLCEDIHQL